MELKETPGKGKETPEKRGEPDIDDDVDIAVEDAALIFAEP